MTISANDNNNSNSKKPSFTFVCGDNPQFGPGCGKVLTLNEAFKNKDGTKKVPLEFSYDSVGQIQYEPHRCPVKEQARKEQMQRLADKVDSFESKLTEIEYKQDQILSKLESLEKLFTPQPLGV